MDVRHLRNNLGHLNETEWDRERDRVGERWREVEKRKRSGREEEVEWETGSNTYTRTERARERDTEREKDRRLTYRGVLCEQLWVEAGDARGQVVHSVVDVRHLRSNLGHLDVPAVRLKVRGLAPRVCECKRVCGFVCFAC